MEVKTYSKLATEDIFGTIEELTRSGMIIEFSSFESTREVGKVVFSCKIKSYTKGQGFQEHSKGYGDDLFVAFNQAYNRLNQIGRSM